MTSAEDTVTPFEVWIEFLEAACAVNEYAAPAREPGTDSKRGDPAGRDAPGSDFNRRGTWAETGLFDAGWSRVGRSNGDAGLVCRPGKGFGVSGSIGTVTSKENGWPLFWCWSTSADKFVPEQPYTRFGVYATLNHGGDYRAAAKALWEKGYGNQGADPAIHFAAPASREQPAAGERPFKWMSELNAQDDAAKWVWQGYIARGAVTMLSALWKAGKSTLMSHTLRSFDGRSDKFLGMPIAASRVLYVSEEHEELWAERRDELNIGDHVGMITRPFRGRASPAEWAGFLQKIERTVREYRFDVVVFDTISKMWPVREENDAGQVEVALMPMWAITDLGVAIVLVHHNRKSDGDEFTGSRGSGGLPAFCDILVEFRRSDPKNKKDRKRVLSGGGRYRETPDKLLIELTPAGYVAHGDPDEMTREQRVTFGIEAEDDRKTPLDLVTEVLTASADPWMTSDDIRDAIRTLDKKGGGIRDSLVSEALTDLAQENKLRQKGKAKSRTDPRKFALAARVDVLPSSADPTDTAGRTRGQDSNEPDTSLPASPARESCPTRPKGRQDSAEDESVPS